MSEFEVYSDKKGETRFRYPASNGEILFSSEGYKAKASAMRSIDSLKREMAFAEVVEEPAIATPNAKRVQRQGRDVAIVMSPEEFRRMAEAARRKVNPAVERLHTESAKRWATVYEALAT